MFSSNKKINLILNISDFSIEAIALSEAKNKNFSAEVLNKIDLLPVNSEFHINLERNLEKSLKTIIHETIYFCANGSDCKPKFNINSCLAVISSPWHISKTAIIKIKKDEPFIFNKSFLDGIKEKEKLLFKLNKSLKFIEADIMKVKLNGYETGIPFGKKAKSSDVYFYFSAVRESFFNFINDIIKRELNIINDSFLVIKTFPSALFSLLKNNPDSFLENNPNCIFLYFGDEITELILIKDGYFEEIVNLSRGYHFFIRRIMIAFNQTFQEAESIFLRYYKGDMHNAARSNIDKIMENTEKEWKDSFSKMILDLAKDHFLPEKLFLLPSKPAPKNIFSAIPKFNFVLNDSLFSDLERAQKFSNPSSGLIIEFLRTNKILNF